VFDRCRPAGTDLDPRSGAAVTLANRSEVLHVTSTPIPQPRPGRTGHAVVDLIDQSHACLAEAASAGTAAQRYSAAHLAALRAGAAVLAARARSAAAGSGRSRGRGPRSVWVVLTDLAPELGEWAGYFAAGAGKRAAAEAGLPHAVTTRDADDLLRDAEAFLALVCAILGMPHQEPLSAVVPRLAG
jgi:hypothetical protein